ncbi:MAG: zf-HC2 domain-containing protein [Pyrinomonadaceae bacterium]|nr:zf-HC2 domain-containing protein [Pyrinomonadaceae bacterium]
MDCTECQELVSLFLDGELDEASSASVRTHLTLCAECAKVCEDFASILDSCDALDVDEALPPNPQALWCRISNTIESEIKPPVVETPEPEKPSRWNFSFAQIASAMVGIAFISSLLTVVGIRNYMEPASEDFTSRSAESQTTFERVLAKVGLMETPQEARERRLREQQEAIAYWDRRVQARKAQWDRRMREAFDRNLAEIDQAVSEYKITLEQDPEDELSGEMLDAALNDKMNLLRQFSQL